MSYLSKTARFVVWVCSKFTKTEIEQIVVGLSDVLENSNPEVKPKDDFKEKHPNYRNFIVYPKPPLTGMGKPHLEYNDSFRAIPISTSTSFMKFLTLSIEPK